MKRVFFQPKIIAASLMMVSGFVLNAQEKLRLIAPAQRADTVELELVAPEKPAPPKTVIAQNRRGPEGGGGGGGVGGGRGGGQPEVRALARAHGWVGSDRASRPLVIRNSKTDQKTLEQINEDFLVMSVILEKNLKSVANGKRWTAMGVDILTLPGHRPTRHLYVEDYGAIFSYRVNIPLLPEAKSDPDEKQKEGEIDSDWEAAKSELFGERTPWRKEMADRERSFDPRVVEDLRENLIESLRNAANIRNLKNSDWVTLVVTGLGRHSAGAPVEVDFHFNVGEGVFFGPGDDPAGGSTMVIRAKKSDIDEFAKRKGDDLEDFKKKVSVVVY